LVMSISREREISLVSNQKYPSIQIANGALESKWRVCHGRGKNLASVTPWHVHVWMRANATDQNIDIPAQL
jgi:hypothetical protein